MFCLLGIDTLKKCLASRIFKHLSILFSYEIMPQVANYLEKSILWDRFCVSETFLLCFRFKRAVHILIISEVKPAKLKFLINIRHTWNCIAFDSRYNVESGRLNLSMSYHTKDLFSEVLFPIRVPNPSCLNLTRRSRLITIFLITFEDWDTT